MSELQIILDEYLAVRRALGVIAGVKARLCAAGSA
jgi:hypothetical protein